MTAALLAGVLATNNFGDTREGGVAGPIAFLILLVVAGVTIFLIHNMNARLRRLPHSFPEPPPAESADRRSERPEAGAEEAAAERPSEEDKPAAPTG